MNINHCHSSLKLARNRPDGRYNNPANADESIPFPRSINRQFDTQKKKATIFFVHRREHYSVPFHWRHHTTPNQAKLFIQSDQNDSQSRMQNVEKLCRFLILWFCNWCSRLSGRRTRIKGKRSGKGNTERLSGLSSWILFFFRWCRFVVGSSRGWYVGLGP